MSTYARSYYPVFLNLRGRKAVVVGAGGVAARKVATLVEYGADVTVIAPEADPAIESLAREGTITLLCRTYEKGDLADAFLVIGSTDNKDVNLSVYAEAEAQSSLVNIVDVPALCNFIVPSIVRRGPLQIAISTAGNAPAAAKRIRRELQQRYGDEWGDYVSLMGAVREMVLERVPGGEPVRKPIFEAIAGSDLFERVSRGQAPSAQEIFDEFVPPDAIVIPEAAPSCEETGSCPKGGSTYGWLSCEHRTS